MEENWTAVKSSIVSVAETSIGRRRRQPERFENNSETLTPLIKAKNDAYAVSLGNSSQAMKMRLG
jgi:hypothetical protein